jgi:hypothetical protein
MTIEQVLEAFDKASADLFRQPIGPAALTVVLARLKAKLSTELEKLVKPTS